MSATGSTPQPRPYRVGGVRVSDLLASCAAADVISRPPRDPEPAPERARDVHGARDARKAEERGEAA
ncbi:hypothetical protein ACF1A5_01365 [Streptomyces sp. NPDC014864]|uniref:hypothetical protein n=1 Tax=Streptomyces sp. NPDC014864 TaxID=3364924 RepID=UPI0036F55512